MGALLEVSISDGKYTVVFDPDHGLRVLRYGEPWRNATGDNLIFSLAQAVRELEAERDRLREANKESNQLLKEILKVMKADVLHRGTEGRRELWRRVHDHREKLTALEEK